jgi:hypothetical protein
MEPNTATWRSANASPDPGISGATFRSRSQSQLYYFGMPAANQAPGIPMAAFGMISCSGLAYRFVEVPDRSLFARLKSRENMASPHTVYQRAPN